MNSFLQGNGDNNSHGSRAENRSEYNAEGGIGIKTKKFLAFLIIIALFVTPAHALAAVPETLVPMGNVVGISAEIDGAMVIETVAGSAAEAAGIVAGDVIKRIGDVEIDTEEQINNLLCDCGEVTVTVSRGGKMIDFDVTPQNGRLGVWLRNGIDGIGTVTYYDPADQSFGALGHPIKDIDTEIMLPVSGGSITNARLTGIMVSRVGSPGQLQGVPDFENVLGSISDNRNYGVFGHITDGDFTADRAAYPVADSGEVQTGDAVILSDAIDGVVREYEVKITRLFSGFVTDGKDMMITVTDDRLLDAAGGIVQGMSGSPIIQDGKLVGAVTHVLVNEPDKGYGIFIETMYQ